VTDASAIARAEQRARKLYPRSKGFRGAYVKGACAALAGRTSVACPYPERPSKTWGRAWRLAWMRGHQSARTIDDEG
jgi:ribosome modulation factor